MIEWDLFGTVRLVCHWDRIGTNGQELVEAFVNETEAGQALKAIGICEIDTQPDGVGPSPSLVIAIHGCAGFN